MKTSITTSLFFLLFLSLLSNGDGAFPENTGAPNELTCGRAPCHNIPSNIGQSLVQIDLEEGADTYMADTEQAITVSISNTSSTKHGFEIVALDSNNENVGTWILTEPEQMKIIAGFGLPDRMYVTHTAAGNQLTSWTMNWKAPTTDVGDITFYTSVLAANNNGASSGDSLYNISKTISFEEMVNVHDNTQNLNIQLFPNPTSDVLWVEHSFVESLLLNIYTTTGKTVFQKVIHDSQEKIHVQQWEKGIYIMQFIENGHSHIRRFVIK